MWCFLFLLPSCSKVLFLTHLFFFKSVCDLTGVKDYISSYGSATTEAIRNSILKRQMLQSSVWQFSKWLIQHFPCQPKPEAGSNGSNTQTQDLFLLIFKLDCKQPSREGLGDTGRWESGQEPALCACSPERHFSLGLHKKNLSNRLREVILLLVRPHLATASSSPVLWGSQQKDTDLVEWVQRRATKVTRGLKHLFCQERLGEPGLLSREKRMPQVDLIAGFQTSTGT